MKEVDFFGLFLSPFLAWSLLAFVIFFGLHAVLDRLGVYRRIWHRSLFDLSLYLILLAILVYLVRSFSL